MESVTRHHMEWGEASGSTPQPSIQCTCGCGRGESNRRTSLSISVMLGTRLRHPLPSKWRAARDGTRVRHPNQDKIRMSAYPRLMAKPDHISFNFLKTLYESTGIIKVARYEIFWNYLNYLSNYRYFWTESWSKYCEFWLLSKKQLINLCERGGH